MSVDDGNEIASHQVEDSGDGKVDGWSILVIFTTVVLAAVHFASGFTFDL